MSKASFTLVSLFGAVMFAAIACAAMAKPSYAWASAVWTATVTILAGSLIGCFFGTRQSRAFSAGFAVFGWGHMILFIAPWFDDHTGELLITRHLVDYIGLKFGHEVVEHATMPGIWSNLKHAEHGHIPAYVYLAYIVIAQSLV